MDRGRFHASCGFLKTVSVVCQRVDAHRRVRGGGGEYFGLEAAGHSAYLQRRLCAQHENVPANPFVRRSFEGKEDVFVSPLQERGILEFRSLSDSQPNALGQGYHVQDVVSFCSNQASPILKQSCLAPLRACRGEHCAVPGLHGEG